MSELLLTGASRWFGNVVAVNDVTMRIGPGVTGLLGPNGAGKTTLLGMMSGFLAPSAGSVTLDGEPVWRHTDVYRRIGLVPEREISFVHDPQVLLLDEPFNGVDPRQRAHLMRLLRAMGDEGRTVLFSSHILEEVEQLARHIEVLVAGRHAASGDFTAIRRLMTDRPVHYLLRSSDDRRLAAVLIGADCVHSVALATRLSGGLEVQVSDLGAFAAGLPGWGRDAGITIRELVPTDESLESVFAYLVAS